MKTAALRSSNHGSNVRTIKLKIVSSNEKPCDCESSRRSSTRIRAQNCQLRGGRRSYPFCEYLARIGPLLRGSCEDSTTPAIAASLYVPWRTQHAIPFSSMLRCGSVTLGTIKHVAGPMRAWILVRRPPAAAATALAGGGSVACRKSWSWAVRLDCPGPPMVHDEMRLDCRHNLRASGTRNGAMASGLF